MARCVESVFNTLLFALVFVTAAHGTREIFPEKCEDQYGADLNGNFALNRQASQTSTANNGAASRAVDGNRNAYFGNNSCSETDFGLSSWSVDLGTEIYVTSVTITTRADAYWREKSHWSVSVMNGGEETPCASGFFIYDGGTTTYACEIVKKGTSVKIQQSGGQRKLSLCEMEVHGHPLDFYENEVNYALLQAARISTLYQSHSAFRGVDGVRNPVLGAGSCFHTSQHGGDWWSVDLGIRVDVYAVAVTNRDVVPERMGNFEIRIGENWQPFKNPACNARQSLGSSETRAIFCSRPMRGTSVGILQKRNDPMNVCEVSVHGREVPAVTSNEPVCLMPQPLGMEDNTILTSQLTASSQYNTDLGVHQSRLNSLGSWASLNTASESRHWIQVGFLWPSAVTEIWTQGRVNSDHWVTNFRFSSSNDFVVYESYKNTEGSLVFPGNSDAETVVAHHLQPIRVVRVIRIDIHSFNNHPSMRMEFVGCYYKDIGFPLPQALGMQSKAVTDDLITSSTELASAYGKNRVRLMDSVAWIPTNEDPDPWIQINFVLTVTVLEILTQGRSRYNQWTKNYKVAFAQQAFDFVFYRDENGQEKLFRGNTDRNTIVRNALSPAIRAQFIRIYPKDYQAHRAIRLEFIGYYKDQKSGPLGLEDGRVENVQLSASTNTEDSDHHARDGRLHDPIGWGAGTASPEQWLQVDFLRLVRVTEIWTQGKAVTDPDEWIGSYYVDYSLGSASFTTFSPYGLDLEITANVDGYSVVKRPILPAIEARVIRIRASTFTVWVSLRMEVIGYYITCTASRYARPLGMESGEISDMQITASSVRSGEHLAGGARLNLENNAPRRGWSARLIDRTAWLQVEFYQTANIIEVQAQARYSSETFYNYTLSYGDNGVDFTSYEQDDVLKVFEGSLVPKRIISHSLWPVITARFIRINAVSCAPKRCALKAEFIGTYEGIHGPALIDPEFVEFENTLSASSFADWNHQPHHGVISKHFRPRAWSPVKKERGEFIQIDLLQLTVITAIGFRLAGDKIQDHYTKLALWYGDTEESLKFFKDSTGNMMLFKTSELFTTFEKTLLARYVRLSIDSWETRPDFRFQLYGTTVYSEATAGVETGSIKDEQMKSSNHPNDPYPAHEGRLNGPSAWCGSPSRKKLYLQIDFLWNFEVHVVATQGKDIGIMEYVTTYKLSSTMDGVAWDMYKENQTAKIFTGNTKNCRCIRRNPVQPFLARALRFLPTRWKDAPCMRVEVFGVYKGILRIYARSGVFKGTNETVVTRRCSIKLNGKEVSQKMSGYNVVVANQATGALISSASGENPSDVNNLLMNIPKDSIVVVATQNVTQRPTNETLHLLESLGAIRLRYSITSANLLFLLVGYKGDKRITWIKEKVGTSKDGVIRIAVPIKLNEDQVKPAVSEFFVNSDNTNETDVTLSGYNVHIFRNMTGRCSENDTECEMALSLSMWMKQEPPHFVENVEPAPTSERIDLQYYSQGYNYIVLADAKTWDDSHRYCLGIGATLPIYHDEQTRDYLRSLRDRLGLGIFNAGLRLHSHTLKYFEWLDGSPAVYLKWNPNEPSGLPERCGSETTNALNDVECDRSHGYKFICQQPIQALLAEDLFPLGMENKLIPDASIAVSTEHNAISSPKHYGRLNRNGLPWCAKSDDEAPFIQVDLVRLTRVCAVATQGRGHDLSTLQYPTAFWVQSSNDSLNWVTLLHHEKKKYFHGNHDNFGIVINRFPEPLMAQVFRINVEKWNGNQLCMRIELFGCETAEDKNDQKVNSIPPPKSIADDTPKTCLDWLMRGKTSSGVYMIDPDGRGVFPAFCENEIDDGGWTVFQHRFDGSVDFNRIWDEYKWGFGDRYGEHWLGLEYISRLTHASVMDLRVDLETFGGSSHYTIYYVFTVGDEATNYIVSIGEHAGPGTDSFTPHNNSRFETMYRNLGNKPLNHHGAWWYGNSVKSNLNGKYFNQEVNNDDGMFWHGWKQHKSLKIARMMIREGASYAGSAVGMKYNYIQDYQITATGHNSDDMPPTRARLDHTNYWEGRSGQHLLINLISPRRITHISTQAGNSNSRVVSFAVKFKLVNGTIIDYKENGKKREFEGNNRESSTNQNAIISNCFKEPVEATEMHFVVMNCFYGRCSLRMELYTCEDDCSASIGIQSGFPLDRISSPDTTSPLENVRLSASSPAWNSDFNNDWRPYIEVKFLELFKVTAIATQGGTYSVGGGQKNCFVLHYLLMYLNKRMKWDTYGGKKPKILLGNKNARTVVKNKLEAPFLANAVRLAPWTAKRKACLKFEIYGCYPDNPSLIIFTESVRIGERTRIKGRYRYCPNCDECPGCIKSLCLRIFEVKYLLASYFSHDCVYHDFDIQVQTSVVPGRHRVYLIESEYGNCHLKEEGSSEKFVGNIYVKKEPSNCLELLLSGNTENGKYFIDPDGKGSFQVYCDQTLYGGGWTVFQTRASTAENFDRPWNQYKSGFGNLDGNFWLANEYIHRLTVEKKELGLEMQSNNNDNVDFVLYKSFRISDEADGYRLHIADYEPSPAGNCLEQYNGVKFTTHDRDHDEKSDGSCAHGANSGFGWWFRDCSSCGLNGKPQNGIDSNKQLFYETWTNNIQLQQAKMKLRDTKTVFCGAHYCYYLLKTWNSWFEASQRCKKFNSDLMSIRDATENEWVRKEILMELGIDKVHIGLQNTTWTDGGTFDYHNFTGDEENDLCPVLTRDGSWLYQDCTIKSPTLCKRGKWCFKGKCHVYRFELMTFNNAMKYCDDIGYKLTKIRNADEYSYFGKIIRAATQQEGWLNVYIGLKMDSLRQPYWYDGKKVRYTAWVDGEPNQDSRSCARFYRDGWMDAVCEGSIASRPLCEKVYQEHSEDCLDLLLSGKTANGIYTIDPDGLGPLQVYCDQETFGGGWTLLLRRVDSTLSFEKEWKDYKDGFGDLERNFWLGNEYNHRLTKIKQEVLFDLDSVNGDSGFALYKTFQVGNEDDKYSLALDNYQTSNIGNAMQGNNLMAFTTSDRDNDINSNTNCGDDRKAGWWFGDCSLSCLTGFHESASDFSWKTWPSNDHIAKAEMKIRTSSVVTCNDQYCYYLRHLKKTWSEALQECRNFNADLVSIHSDVELEFILENIIEPQSVESVHLGLTGSNYWTDGKSATYSKLTSGLIETQCTSMLQSGDWMMNECDEKKTVLCKRAKHCYKGDCYLFGASVTGDSLFSHCEDLGYRAAKISNRDDQEYLLKLVRESTADSSFPLVHFGLVLSSDNDRIWHDGTMVKYNGWIGTEPNNPTGEKYTAFDQNGWYDVPWHFALTSLCEKAPIIEDCSDVKQKYDRSDSGVYAYNSKDQKTFPAHCEPGSIDGSWLVIQRRVQQTSLADFSSHSWVSYKDGLGTKESNFWLGNKYIHELTWNNPHRLKIVIHTEDFQRYEATYEDFYLSPQESGFAINFGTYSGNAGDALSRHRGKPFSASDDDRSGFGCAANHQGGWWFENCLDSNLNGAFTSPSNSETTIFWRTINANIVKTEMKIQPYPKGSGVNKKVQRQATSLSLASKQNWMEINLRTASQQWTAHVVHPGPFMTHVFVSWEESSYLKYYENGTLVAAVPAIMNERPVYPYTSLSVFVDLPYLWLHQMKLYNQALTSSNAYDEYALTEITFDDDEELRWTFNHTSNYTWEPRKACTPSNETGPCGDHTYYRNTGTYMVTEASRPAFEMDIASMETRTFLDHYKCLSFWYHLYGRRMGTLSVYAQDSNEKRIFLGKVSGNVGNVWRLMQVNLEGEHLDISGVFKIIIEAERGEGFQSDAAVDDISLSSKKCKLECDPPCEARMKCDLKTLQCVYKGIYDHLWALDSLSEADDKGAFSDVTRPHGRSWILPGVIDEAIQYSSGSHDLAFLEDKCWLGECFPKFTLSLWLKYKEIPNSYQYLTSLGGRFQLGQISEYASNNYLYVYSYVALRKCEFKVFAPAEVWNHVIFSVDDENFTMHLNGREVENTTMKCLSQVTGPGSYNPFRLGKQYGSIVYTTGTNTRDFAADDVRLLFDALSTEDTLEHYKTLTGYNQTIWFKANFTTITWQEELGDDESDAFRSMSRFLRNKVMDALGNRSHIEDVSVRKFIHENCTIAEVDIIYREVSYYDILLLEEAIYVNNTFDDLQVNGVEMDSNSAPTLGPDYQLTVVALNSTALSVSWLPISVEDVHGVFKGYKILYTKTENSSYTEYISVIKYANYTEMILTGLVPVTNYTLRILAFSHSGDGLISKPVIVSTLDGEVTVSPNITVANVSSTSLYVNWTTLPISSDEYLRLFGYKFFYWKESEESKVFNMTLAANKSEILFENLEKWTAYCFSIAGFTLAGPGPNGTQCSRTLEDVPEHPPSNVTVVQVTTSSIQLEWQPPANVPGKLRYYNISYRVLNVSDSEVVELTVPGSATSYSIDGLTGLMFCEINITAITIDAGPVQTLSAITLEGAPLAAVNLNLVNISSTALSMNWTELPWQLHNGILLGYKAFLSNVDSQTFTAANEMSFSPNEFHQLMTNMSKWTTYCAQITAFTAVGNGPMSTRKCIRTFEDVPEDPPSNVTVVQVTTSSIHLEWQPPANVPGKLRYYNISYRVLNVSDSEVVELTVPGSATSYSIDSLTGLLFCEINITAITVDAGPGQTIRAITTEGVPLAAVNISLTGISSTALSMNWTELPWQLHNGILLGYKAFLSNFDSQTGTFTAANEMIFFPNEFHQLVMNMSKWTTYCAQITAFTAVGNGPTSTRECTRTFEDAPEEAPGNFNAIEVNVTSIKVEWEPPPASSVPGIIRSYNFTYRNLNYTNENLTKLESGANDDMLLVENLHGLTFYEINVTAVTILPGPWKTLFVLTQEGVPVIPPPNIIWYNVSSTSIKSTWDPIPPHLCNGILVGYNLFFWKQSDPQNVTNVIVSEGVKLFSGLEKWTFYCGQVVAFTKIGEGPRSQVECIRTSEDEPEVPPLNLNGTNTTWTSFFLSWDPIDSQFIPGVLRSYRVSYEIQDPGFNQAYDGSILVKDPDTSVNLTGLIGLTNYKITVSGVTVSDGPPIEVYLQTNEGVPTSPPEDIVPSEVTSTTISLSWKDVFLPERHGLVKGYRVTYKKLERRTRRETEEKTLTFDADVHTAFMYKLDPYTNYSMTVAAFTSKGMGVEEHFLIETMQAAPYIAPKSPYGVNFTGPTTIFIGWGSLRTAELQGSLSGYEVRYREFSVADEIIETPGPEIIKVIHSDINGAKLTGLETYTTYQVRVAAISGGGRGTFTNILYIATCRCHKALTTNYWNYQPYTNISRQVSGLGFFPHLLDMVTLSCCQNCLEHGTSEVDYFHDGLGNAAERDSDMSVKRSLSLKTDFSFPVYGYNGQTTYMKYYGYATIVEVVGTVFFTLKPDYSVTQGNVLLAAVLSIVPFLAIAVIFAYIAGVIMWALESGRNEEEFPSRFFRGAANGFWWAYITMTTVGYGDKTARTLGGRVFAIIWVLTGLCICSLLIGTISTAFTTSTTPPDPEDIMIYGSKVAALQDSPDHKLGLRRNAKVNNDSKRSYQTLEQLKNILLSEAVDGILIDAYVADARRELFSQFTIKKVIDLTSSYGVVMGTDAQKLRKCFNKFWKENAAVRSSYIQENTNPVKITEISAAEQMGESYNPQTALYQISLYSCASALIVLFFCGCVYEVIRRKKISTKVDCEKDSTTTCDLRSQEAHASELLQKNISELRRKQKEELVAFLASQRRKTQAGLDDANQTS